MFKLGTNEVWKQGIDTYPGLREKKSILKQLGYGYIFQYLEQESPLKVLEIGHGASSDLFKEFSDKHEMWGIDDSIPNNSVPSEHLERMKVKQPHVKFIRGLMGRFLDELPENYFDLVCSVSVLEHIPEEQMHSVFSDIKRILKPGGISAHSYDVWWGRDPGYMIQAHEDNGLAWIEDGEKQLPWQIKETSIEIDMDKFFRKIVLESVATIYDVFMAPMKNKQELNICNWCTILLGARKPK